LENPLLEKVDEEACLEDRTLQNAVKGQVNISSDEIRFSSTKPIAPKMAQNE